MVRIPPIKFWGDDWGMVYSIISIGFTHINGIITGTAPIPGDPPTITEIDWAKSHGLRRNKPSTHPLNLSFPSFSHDILILSPFYSHSIWVKQMS
jgi:hypothetical protein